MCRVSLDSLWPPSPAERLATFGHISDSGHSQGLNGLGTRLPRVRVTTWYPIL